MGRSTKISACPSTDELTVSLALDLGRGWTVSLAGFLRETRNLVETANTGVPDYGVRSPNVFRHRRRHDSAFDRRPDRFTIYNQRVETFGADFFLLSNPGSGFPEIRLRRARFRPFQAPDRQIALFPGPDRHPRLPDERPGKHGPGKRRGSRRPALRQSERGHQRRRTAAVRPGLHDPPRGKPRPAVQNAGRAGPQILRRPAVHPNDHRRRPEPGPGHDPGPRPGRRPL